MRKLITSALLLSAVILPAAATSPAFGDMTADAGIGIGMVDYDSESKATFSQRIGVEWCVIPSMINGDFSLSAGLFINNTVGGGYDSKAVGTYNYSYDIYGRNNHSVWSKVNTGHRDGFGTAKAHINRDDINFIPTASFYYHINRDFEVYSGFGIGLGIIHLSQGGLSNFQGFEQKDYESTGQYARKYYYDDLQHAEWSDYSATKVTVAMSFFAGVRYYLGEHWGVNSQFGMVAGNLKDSWGSAYNILSFGASYRF